MLLRAQSYEFSRVAITAFVIFVQTRKALKQASLILNVVLLIAVAVLYFKVFGTNQASSGSPLSAPAQNSRVVYVDSDTLLENYTYFRDLEEQLDKKKDSLERILSAKGQALEREMRDYQEKGAGMSASERQLREEMLMKKQQALMEERDNLLEKLKTEDAALADSIHIDLMKYMKEFNRSHGYDFILGYTRGGGILFANDSLNVTRQVLEGLNIKK